MWGEGCGLTLVSCPSPTPVRHGRLDFQSIEDNTVDGVLNLDACVKSLIKVLALTISCRQFLPYNTASVRLLWCHPRTTLVPPSFCSLIPPSAHFSCATHVPPVHPRTIVVIVVLSAVWRRQRLSVPAAQAAGGIRARFHPPRHFLHEQGWLRRF